MAEFKKPPSGIDTYKSRTAYGNQYLGHEKSQTITSMDTALQSISYPMPDISEEMQQLESDIMLLNNQIKKGQEAVSKLTAVNLKKEEKSDSEEEPRLERNNSSFEI